MGAAARPGIWPLRPVCLSEIAAHPWPERAPARIVHALKGLPLAWPEKAALVTAFIIAALSIIVWITAFAAVGTMAYGRLNNTLAAWAGMAEMAIALPIWILLRTIDLIESGPRRRRAAREHAAMLRFEANPAAAPEE